MPCSNAADQVLYDARADFGVGVVERSGAAERVLGLFEPPHAAIKRSGHLGCALDEACQAEGAFAFVAVETSLLAPPRYGAGRNGEDSAQTVHRQVQCRAERFDTGGRETAAQRCNNGCGGLV